MLRHKYWSVKRKIKSWIKSLRCMILGKGYAYKKRHHGILHPYYIRIGTSDERVEEDVLNLVPNPARIAASTIIDAGANIGLRAIQFANLFPDAVIIAIEPESGNFEMLKRNTAPYSNIRCLKGALWNRDTFLRITNYDAEPWAFVVEEITESTEDDHHEFIQAFSIPTLLASFQISRIGLLKLDIEGSEKELFSDGTDWVNCVDIFMIEFHDRYKNGCSQAFFHAISQKDFSLEMFGENLVIYTKNRACSTCQE